MKVYKVLGSIFNLLMLSFWTLTSLLFINLSLNTSFRLYIQRIFCYADSSRFLTVGLVIFVICIVLGYILYRQNRASCLFISSNNQTHEIGASFMKDLVQRFFSKHSIEYIDLDVVLHKQRLKIFVNSKSFDLSKVTQFEKDLSTALSYQLSYKHPFKISFALFDS